MESIHLIFQLEDRCHLCGEVTNLINLAHETCHGLASIQFIKNSCYYEKVVSEENNLRIYIFFLCPSLIWRHSHDCWSLCSEYDSCYLTVWQIVYTFVSYQYAEKMDRSSQQSQEISTIKQLLA